MQCPYCGADWNKEPGYWTCNNCQNQFTSGYCPECGDFYALKGKVDRWICYSNVENNEVKNFLHSNPIEDEELIFVLNVRVKGTYFGEVWQSALWFRTSHRCGFVGYANCQAFFYHDILHIKNYWIDSEQQQIGIDWVDAETDGISYQWETSGSFTFQPEDFDTAADAMTEIGQVKYFVPHEALKVESLKKIFSFLQSGNPEQALELLYSMKEIDSTCGVLDIMIARTLKELGRSEAASVWLAKNWQKTSMYASILLLTEFLNYKWHEGSLRYLPHLEDIPVTNEYSEFVSLFIKAVKSKAQNLIDDYIDACCKAFLIACKGDVGYTFLHFDFFVKLIPYITKSTYQNISKIAEFILNKLETVDSITAERLSSVSEIVRSFFGEEIRESNYVEVVDKIVKFMPHMIQANHYEVLFAHEDFASVLKEDFKNKQILVPQDWDLENIVSKTWQFDYNCHYPEYRLIKLFANLRTCSKPVGDLIQMHEGLKAQWNYELHEPHYNWLLYLIEVELLIKLNRKDEALETLHKGSKIIKPFTGSQFHPLVGNMAALCGFYEGWAYGAPSMVQDALDYIPCHEPVVWVHKLGNDLIAEMNANIVINDNLSCAMTYLKSLIQRMKDVGNSAWANDNIQASVNHFNGEVAKRLAEAELCVAVGGETSAGKTTLLNSLFNTNMFFVTQEEATGVPTEIRRGDKFSVRVIDKTGHVREKLDVDSRWLMESETKLLAEYVQPVRDFMRTYTRVGEESLNWVSKVEVSVPILDFPRHLVLIDTPGFNAHEERSQIADAAIKDSHACIFVIDARNALKRKEVERLQATKDEISKMFLVLNKMDLVLGDDDLDCDGSEAAEQTIERVYSELTRQFQVDNLMLFPVCSLDRADVPADAYKYVETLKELRQHIVSETQKQRLRLVIDAAVRHAVVAAKLTLQLAEQEIKNYNSEEELLEKSMPYDPKLFESEISDAIKIKLYNGVSNYHLVMTTFVEDMVNSAFSQIRNWLMLASKKDIDKQATDLAQNAIIKSVEQIERERKKELKRLSDSVINELESKFQELYDELPFNADFDSKTAFKSLNKLETLVYVNLQQAISSVDTGPSRGGQMAGVIVGYALLGPVGASLGRWIGGQIFGKSVEQVRMEIIAILEERFREIEQRLKLTIQADLSNDSTATLIPQLNDAVSSQVDLFIETVQKEIERQSLRRSKLEKDLNQLKYTAASVAEDSKKLQQWRAQSRCFKGDYSDEDCQLIDEMILLIKTPSAYSKNNKSINQVESDSYKEVSAALDVSTDRDFSKAKGFFTAIARLLRSK